MQEEYILNENNWQEILEEFQGKIQEAIRLYHNARVWWRALEWKSHLRETEGVILGLCLAHSFFAYCPDYASFVGAFEKLVGEKLKRQSWDFLPLVGGYLHKRHGILIGLDIASRSMCEIVVRDR